MRPQIQRQWQDEFQGATKLSEYDFNKEQWSKQMKMHSMDCIVEPDIGFPKALSFQGAKRKLKQYITLKKITERRPKFKINDLKELFIRYKRVGHGRSEDDARLLRRLTTHAEATRIDTVRQKETNEEFSSKSWKSLKLKETGNEYEIEVDSFDAINYYFGNLTKEDWVQITAKVVYRERKKKSEEFTKVTEYPVFEVCLGDGVNANTHQWIVVGVMNKDGVRYGKDAQDAGEMRKNIAKANKKWF